MEDRQQSKHCVSGTINGACTSTIIRDTGCSSLIVSEDALPEVNTTNCHQVTVLDYLNRADKFLAVRCYLKCPFYDGWVDIIHAPMKCATALIGNILRVCNADDPACSPPSILPLYLFLRETILVHHLMLGLLNNFLQLLKHLCCQDSCCCYAYEASASTYSASLPFSPGNLCWTYLFADNFSISLSCARQHILWTVWYCLKQRFKQVLLGRLTLASSVYCLKSLELIIADCDNMGSTSWAAPVKLTFAFPLFIPFLFSCVGYFISSFIDFWNGAYGRTELPHQPHLQPQIAGVAFILAVQTYFGY